MNYAAPIVTHDKNTRARIIFYEQFNDVHKRAQINKIWSTLIRKDHRLQNLSTAKTTANVQSSQSAGVQLVSIKQIVGSQGRADDFDSEFRPLKKHDRERWLGVAAARYLGQSLPPVSLVRLGCSYYVRDGHHRISVAKTMGQQEIEAEVIMWDAESDAVCDAA